MRTLLGGPRTVSSFECIFVEAEVTGTIVFAIFIHCNLSSALFEFEFIVTC